MCHYLNTNLTKTQFFVRVSFVLGNFHPSPFFPLVFSMKFRYRDFEYCSHFFDEYRRIFLLLLWLSFEEKLFCTMCRCSTSVRLFVWLDSCNHMIRSCEHYISTIISSNEPNTKSTQIFIQFCLAIFDSICEIYTSQFFVDHKLWYCFEWKHCQIKACVNNTRSIWKKPSYGLSVDWN